MKSILVNLLKTIVFLGFNLSTALAGSIYISTSSAELYTYDTNTNTTTLIGSTGVTMWDIAFDPGGQLWGIGNAYDLYQIDPTTGSSTFIGGLGVYANALVSKSDGTLYAAGYSGFYVVDKTTGMAKFVGNIGFSAFGDLEFDVSENLYLMAGSGNQQQQQLVQVNPADGGGTLIGSTGVSGVFGLAFIDGVMFGFANDDVYTINTTTGTASLFDNNIGIRGTAYGASSRFVRFVWPIAKANLSRGHNGPCGDWPGDPEGCYWLSNKSENAGTVWRDVQPFQRHEYKTSKKYYGYHLGADYNLSTGDSDINKPVYPTAFGTVKKVLENVCGWGNIVFVKHVTSFGVYTSMYAHVNWLSGGKPIVDRKVSPMKAIAMVGKGTWTKNDRCNSSGSYPAHLHFELRKGENFTPGPAYTKSKVTKGPQGQINPNAFIASH